jgi:hypothetical protein
LEKLLELLMLNGAKWKTSGCDKLEDFLLEGGLVKILVLSLAWLK